MARVKELAIAASAVLLTLEAAAAADLPPPMAPPMLRPAIVQDFGGWYLRGDIGMSTTSVESISNILDTSPGTTVRTVYADFASGGFFGLGVGYQFNNWLRFDVTGEYRGKAEFQALQIYGFNGAIAGTDEYRAKLSSWVALANVYADLGTWWCITPFIGAGVGLASNRIDSFIDVNTPNLGVAYALDTNQTGNNQSTNQWNFAWALHAGLAYKVMPGFTVELAYRYLNLGDASSGDLITYLGTNNVNNPELFKTLQSHDVKLGVRWQCCEDIPPPPPPLIRKG
jgi:opacity protein-like surface antigen